jgi:alpha-2-macroglobulin-like protein
VVAQKLVRVSRGAIANDFVLDGHLPGGEYKLRLHVPGGPVERSVMVSAYEPPQIQKRLEFLRKAYGPGDQVAASLSMKRGTGEPLAGAELVALVTVDGAEVAREPIVTDAGGGALYTFLLPDAIARGDGLLTVLVADGGLTESIQRRIPIVLDELDVALYPEGGDLVQGLPGRVYFAAHNAIGDPADIAGAIVDDRGQEIARIRSLHGGMGRFEIVPEPGRRYELRVDSPPGIAATYPLPQAAGAGCTMHAVDDFKGARDDVRVAIWCTEKSTVIATAALRERQLGAARIEAGPHAPTVVAIPVPAGTQGAARITVFAGGAPVAERLIYRGLGRDLAIAIEPAKETYTPREQVTLALTTTDLAGEPVSADLAVAVVDDRVLTFADDDTSHLLARVFLEAEMPGQEIDEPNFYFSDEMLASYGLDLVLGTKGWRRFAWEQVLAPREAERRQREVVTPAPMDMDFADERMAAEPMLEGAADAFGGAPALEAEEAPPPAAAPPPPPAQEALAEARFEADDMAPARDVALGAPARRAARVDARRPMQPGWAPVREFPLPNYQAGYDGPRNDFRETVFWSHSVVTDEQGKAEISFPLSDSITSFRAIAEGVSRGGLPGRGEVTLRSVLPVSLHARLPLEVSEGDRVELPITIANETDRPQSAELKADFGPAFSVERGLPERGLIIPPGERRSLFVALRVVGAPGGEEGAGRAHISLRAAGFTDELERDLRVVPRGFPQEVSLAGTVSRDAPARHEIDLAGATEGSLRAQVTLYPSPLATMMSGIDAMVREPTGCFEQASSANYPNIMVLRYFEEHGGAEPQLVERTQGMLDRGYQRLTGYESPRQGYEWFGGDPGHEALTAYGLLQFRDMAAVYGDVDPRMVERTRRWLLSRRDGKGGFQRNPRALDSFGSASEEVTAGYITYALAEAGERDLGPERTYQRRVARDTRDPYLMALATHVLLELDRGGADTGRAVAKLAGMQASDGSFPGADHSITRSGGQALAIETTSLAAMALMKAGDEQLARVRRSIEWLNDQRSGFGGYGSTQSTVLALKTLSRYAEMSRATAAAGTVQVFVNGRAVGEASFDAGQRQPIELGELSGALNPGKNVVEIRLDSDTSLPYSVAVEYTSPRPASSPDAPVAVRTSLAADEVPLGEGVRLDVRVENTAGQGLPMALARVGIPGGLTFQIWQLEELVDRGTIDFFETREREVVLYFRSLAPDAALDVPLELLAAVPGRYEGPASRAYLYYTDELVRWADPLSIRILP